MTSIQDYDSDSDSSTDPQLDTVSELDEDLNLGGSNRIDFTLFLQNYTANMRHLLNVYLYLPLNPLLHTRKLFRKATEVALNSIPQPVVNKYTWDDIGMKVGKIKYHASISGNLSGAPHQIKHFVETFAHGLLEMKIDSAILTLDHEEVHQNSILQKLLAGNTASKDPISSKKKVKLLLEPKLCADISEAIIKIYLSIPIQMGKCEQEFFNKLSTLTESAAASAELAGDISPEGAPHVTINIGTLKDLVCKEFEISRDLETIRDCLNRTDLSTILHQIPIQTEAVTAGITTDNNLRYTNFLLPTT